MRRVFRAFTTTALLTLLAVGPAASAQAVAADGNARQGEAAARPMMFDVIPRWALALGVGTISSTGVGTIAFESLGSAGVTTNAAESLGNSGPACANVDNAVLTDSRACATVADRSTVASLDELKLQLASGSRG
ncbi:hypothetical protein [Streptomyces hiroshimensis]|uniref:Uncharacterized protein n=1 Tax=Streptomyces hiroshimensis TaxID=66424 RepID=A0ABQ2Y9R4_9ACTN|nr:hypothetical protein [Streptomyces hiroshimensis]GGX72437.1 hypothetical protein GCM10010324_17180 [Streptomyces hiroshimensis]